MAQTDIDSVLDTYGATTLSDGQVQQFIDDAVMAVDIRWNAELLKVDVSNLGDVANAQELVERAERLMACHLMKDAEPEEESSDTDPISTSVNIPDGNIHEWLKNTTHGRTLIRFLSGLGIAVDQSTGVQPRNFA